MNKTKATFTKVGNVVVIRSPYSAPLVEEIKAIAGRHYNPDMKAWSVPMQAEEQARQIVRQYFQIEGEDITPALELVEAEVTGANTYKRSYPEGVEIDGEQIFYLDSGELRHNGAGYKILKAELIGGQPDRRHAFEVTYRVTVQCRKGSNWQATGRVGKGKIRILSVEAEHV